MKITFIRPSMIVGVGGDALEPLAFGILAGLTPRDVELRLYDERIETIDFDEPTDLAAISCETFSARRSYQIAAEYRKRGVPVVIGGCHPTLWTDEALQYVETVVVGEAEDTWPAVVEDARCGRLQRIYRSQQPPLAGLRVDRRIFAGKKYGPMRLVQVGRGCGHSCDFCSIHALYGSRIRYRSVEEVIDEIGAMKARAIIFTDDNLFANKPLAVELLRRLEPLRIPMPGTPLYERLHAEGRLRHDPWWLDPDYRYGEAPFHPKGMNAQELTEGIFHVRRKFNSIASIAWRALNARANTRSLGNAEAYLAVNWINRREIHRKQGLPLGAPGKLKPLESVMA